MWLCTQLPRETNNLNISRNTCANIVAVHTLTREMDDLNTPAKTAVAATTAYTPGWMFQDSGSHISRFSPTMPPKEAPTCVTQDVKATRVTRDGHKANTNADAI